MKQAIKQLKFLKHIHWNVAWDQLGCAMFTRQYKKS